MRFSILQQQNIDTTDWSENQNEMVESPDYTSENQVVS